VIKLISDLRHVDDFFLGTPVSSTNKTGRHDTTEILLKVVLNAIAITHNPNNSSHGVLVFNTGKLIAIGRLKI